MDAIPLSRSESLSWAFTFGWGPLHHPLNTLSTEFLFGIFMSPLVCDHRHHVVGHVVRPSGRMDKVFFRDYSDLGGGGVLGLVMASTVDALLLTPASNHFSSYLFETYIVQG